MSIVTNISAQNALAQGRLISGKTAVATERLSSALRINHGADDPAGLGIAVGMKGQIRGMNQAAANAQDGLKMLSTMDGSLAEINELLIQMREIAVRAANEAPLTDGDRSKLNEEMLSLKDQVTKTAEASVYDSKHLLTGGAEPGEYKIVFTTQPSGFVINIGIINDDGAGFKEFDQPGTDTTPALSPDGTKIAFSSNRSGNYQIYVMNSDGSNPIDLTNNNGLLATNPVWSPDGTKIAFWGGTNPGNYEIYTMNSDGSNLTDITNNPAEDLYPSLSPDGSKIAFTSKRNGNREIYIMNSDGTNPVRITNNPAMDQWPRWSPDGTKLLFNSNRNGVFQIYSMDADGSNLVQLTNNATSDNAPSWSPDGTKIAFYNNREIYTMNSDGSNIVNITNSPASDAFPSYGGVISDQYLQVGPDNGADNRIEVRLPDARAASLGISGVKAGTVAGARNAIESIDKAIGKISEYRTFTGTAQNRLEHVIDENSMDSINISSSNSRIEDADMAAEATDLVRSQIKEQGNLAASVHTQDLSRSVISLLKEHGMKV